MADFKDGLKDYVEVPDRIREFMDKYPEGSIQPAEWTPEFKQLGDKLFIIYTSVAYRTPDDSRPGIGMAWEPFPGKTPYTKDSELMNAETSAVGRALAALGFVGKKGKAKVATKEEVAARQGNGKPDTIGKEGAEKLVVRAADVGAGTKALSLWLTSKKIAHPELDGQNALSVIAGLSPELGNELFAWLGRDVEAKETAA